MSTTDDKTLSAYDAAVDAGDDGSGVDEKRGNAQDRADMFRMGKVQEMKVRSGSSREGVTMTRRWIAGRY